MAEFTDADVTRLAEMLEYLGVMLPDIVARRLLEQGVTLPPPPPDPVVVLCERVWLNTFRSARSDLTRADLDRFIAAVRDLFPPDALEAAAAKVQGVQT